MYARIHRRGTGRQHPAVGLRFTEGWSRLIPSVFVVVIYMVGIVPLSVAVKTIPVSTAYAVWVGIGAVGTAILGIVLLGEAANPGRILSLVLIVVGIVGLKIATPA